MTGSEYIVEYLIKLGVADVFGIPGGVVLPLLNELDNKKEYICAHLCFNELMAASGAIGYSQSTGGIGVAYATRGPGILNMFTGMAEAYFESAAVLFLTSHVSNEYGPRRCESDQEIDLIDNTRGIVKASYKIETADELTKLFPKACDMALSGRKGSVFVDIKTSVYSEIVNYSDDNTDEINISKSGSKVDVTEVVSEIIKEIKKSKRPVILVGDGIRQAGATKVARSVIGKMDLPVISSRGAQDLLSQPISGRNNIYFGYIGSHGVRYSNFILSKADCIISIGNRLSFPLNSQSYQKLLGNIKFIRIDIDDAELDKNIDNCIGYNIDIKTLLQAMDKGKIDLTGRYNEWKEVCNTLYNELKKEDVSAIVREISNLFDLYEDCKSIVCDVGNNEFWTSRAYEYSRPEMDIYVSKSFGTLGLALGKAIGVYYGTLKPVLCIMGDQGFQFNSQEIQYIANWRLPIAVIIINNSASGMIRDKQEAAFNKSVHTTTISGYSVPDFELLAKAYGVSYYLVDENENVKSVLSKEFVNKFPQIVEMRMNPLEKLTPNLPKGNACQNQTPLLDEKRYKYLNDL